MYMYVCVCTDTDLDPPTHTWGVHGHSSIPYFARGDELGEIQVEVHPHTSLHVSFIRPSTTSRGESIQHPSTNAHSVTTAVEHRHQIPPAVRHVPHCPDKAASCFASSAPPRMDVLWSSLICSIRPPLTFPELAGFLQLSCGW